MIDRLTQPYRIALADRFLTFNLLSLFADAIKIFCRADKQVSVGD